MSKDTEQRATLTLTIEGGSFNDMDLSRTGQIFSLLGDIAGKGSTLVLRAPHSIVVEEGYPGSVLGMLSREEVEDPHRGAGAPKPVMGAPPYRGSNDA